MHRMFFIFLLCLVLLFGAAHAEGAVAYLSPEEAPSLAEGALLEIHFIGIGAADAILLRMGDETMLVDCGYAKTGEATAAYLHGIGVTRLTWAFATHPHDDHMGGFPAVLSQIPADCFLMPRLFEKSGNPEYTATVSVLAEKNIPLRFMENEAMMSLGSATLTFYQWEDPDASVNNRSMIIKVTLGERAALLCADLGNGGQKALTAQYGDALRADILKMPHHGIGIYRPELREAVQPEFAVVTNTKAGSECVLDAFDRHGVRWMLTTQGTAVCVTDGEHWQVWQIPK